MFVDTQVYTELVGNGQQGEAGDYLARYRYDANLSRPFLDDKGRACVRVNRGRRDKDGKPVTDKMLVNEARALGIPVLNTSTLLRKDEWIRYDETVLQVQRENLRAYADLVAASNYGGFDGMSKSILEWETSSDPGEVFVDMDGLSEGRSDRMRFQREGMPLPITHSGFSLSLRQLSTSRNMGTPLDTLQLESCTRRVVEQVERALLGTVTAFAYGLSSSYSQTSKVYGYTTYPERIVKNNLTAPTGSNPEVTVGEVLTMLDLASAQNFNGPFMLYHSNDWDKYLDNDYARLGGNNANMTLRDRLRKIDRIRDVRRLDYLSSTTNPFTLIMVQMTSNVVQAVTGMPIRVLQWEEKGGMELKFRVMGILTQRFRADYNGNCGVVHGSTS